MALAVANDDVSNEVTMSAAGTSRHFGAMRKFVAIGARPAVQQVLAKEKITCKPGTCLDLVDFRYWQFSDLTARTGVVRSGEQSGLPSYAL